MYKLRTGLVPSRETAEKLGLIQGRSFGDRVLLARLAPHLGEWTLKEIEVFAVFLCVRSLLQ